MTHPVLSVLVATIDRPRHLTAALTSYARWPERNFDVWVLDDSGAGNVPDVCERFRDQLDLHLVKFDKPQALWRGPETAYSVGLELARGESKVITQEGTLVPVDLLPRLMRHLAEVPVVNVWTWSSHPHGTCHNCVCASLDYLSMEAMFLSGAVDIGALMALHGIPHFEIDHPMFYAATSDAWARINYFPRKNRPYGETDGVLMNVRKQQGVRRLVPDDIVAYHLGDLLGYREAWDYSLGEGDASVYQVVY